MIPVRPSPAGQHDGENSDDWIEPGAEQGVLPRLLTAIVSRFWVMALAMTVTLAAAVAYLATATSVYQAGTDVLVTPVAGDSVPPGFGLILDSSDPERATETVARFVMTPAVAQRVHAKLGGSESAQQLLHDIQAKPVAQSNLVTITAKADQARAAARLADAFAQALLNERTARMHRAVSAAIRVNDARLAGLNPADASQRERLLARGTDLQTLQSAPDPSLEVASNADVPNGPVSPRPALVVAGALLAGAVLGVLGVLALEYLDPRLWREDQLSQSYRLPVLARIPRQRRRRSGPLAPDSLSRRAADGYRMLWANLPSVARTGVHAPAPGRGAAGVLDARPPDATRDGHRQGTGGRESTRYVMVTSALTAEGKTTGALNLAATLADSGEQVILIDADRERPSIAEALGLGEQLGLASVLSQRALLVNALVPVRLGRGMVYVLPAAPAGASGAPPEAAAGRLEDGSASGGSVVVDPPPLTSSPDALQLARGATDLLIAVRLKFTKLRE